MITRSRFASFAATYLQALLEGRREDAWLAVDGAIAAGATIPDLYLHVFQASQYEAGRLWELNQITVAQEHYATAATQMFMSRLQPRVFGTPRNGHSALVAGVGGELHELGPRMIADLLEIDGWDTWYAGAWLPAEEIATATARRNPHLVCLSCTMNHHLGELEQAVRQLRSGDPKLKILVGGRPFNLGQAQWEEVGADGSATDAAEAVSLARRMLV